MSNTTPSNVLYALCLHCDHFVEENTAIPDDAKVLRQDATSVTFEAPSTKVGSTGTYQDTLARHVHLDSGDAEYDHDAEPGETHTLDEWHALRPDLFVTHKDGRDGPNSDFHGNLRGKVIDPFSDADVFVRQRTKPIFVTNGCCEPAHGSPQVFEELGLPYGPPDPTSPECDNWGTAYPLTKDEEKYIGEDCTAGGKHGFVLGHSVLYQNRKWLAPLIEVCYFTGIFSRESYGPDGVHDNYGGAMTEANRIADLLRPKVEAEGGKVEVVLEAEQDRHDVLALFPFEHAKKFGDYKAWRDHLTGLLAGL